MDVPKTHGVIRELIGSLIEKFTGELEISQNYPFKEDFFNGYDKINPPLAEKIRTELGGDKFDENLGCIASSILQANVSKLGDQANINLTSIEHILNTPGVLRCSDF
ncbi:hypothetical protein FACS189449_09020 [Alphaproteobacteria bacterium]|nr:hypothetical protein FACS189449_09020 [Alphaproteobacteria bacterium]